MREQWMDHLSATSDRAAEEVDSAPAQGSSQVDTAVELLRARIIDLSLEPGYRLDERLLSERFGLGRTPAREALNRLATEGFVEIRPKREGIFVAPLGLRQFEEVIEANQFCETLLGYRVRLDDRHLYRDMREIQTRYTEAVRALDYPRITELNVEFHMRCYATLRNDLIAGFAQKVLRHAARLLNYTYMHEVIDTAHQARQFDLNLAQHEEILAAIETCDAARFKLAVVDHVQYLHHRLVYLLDRRMVNAEQCLF